MSNNSINIRFKGQIKKLILQSWRGGKSLLLTLVAANCEQNQSSTSIRSVGIDSVEGNLIK